MRPPLFGRIAILGTGLIGASIASALAGRHVASHLALYDRDQTALKHIKISKAAHSLHANAQEAVEYAEMVILAVPPSALAGIMKDISGKLQSGCIVTDVTSIKRTAIAAIQPHMPAHSFFVPGHPIAGSERSGAEAANPNLFEDKAIILTPGLDDVLSEPVSRVRQLWEAMGSRVEYMPAPLHDRLYAYISHLPQLVAFAASSSLSSGHELTAGAKRLSQSSPTLWEDICFANADYLREALDELCTFLSQIRHELIEEDESTAPVKGLPTDALLCSLLGLNLVATTLLLEQQTGLSAQRYCGSGFRSMTSAAGQDSDSILSAISDQPRAVAALLTRTLDNLNAIGAAISTENHAALLKLFGA